MHPQLRNLSVLCLVGVGVDTYGIKPLLFTQDSVRTVSSQKTMLMGSVFSAFGGWVRRTHREEKEKDKQNMNLSYSLTHLSSHLFTYSSNTN